MNSFNISFDFAKQGGTTEDMTLFWFVIWRWRKEAAQSSNSDAVILVIKKTLWYEEERPGGTRWVYIPISPAKPALGHAKHVLSIIERAAT